MSHLFATAGSKLDIGPAKAYNDTDFTSADFAGLSWVNIGGVTNLGSAGDAAELISSGHLGNARTRKLKGLRNAGSMEVVADLDYADAGQLAVLAAEKTKETYAFRITLNDAPAGGTPSYRYFVALVMSAAEQYDEANNTVKLNATLEIDSNIARTNAAAAGSAPDNTALPTITGTATENETLTASPGTWSGSPTPSYTYQWYGDGESLSGETGTTLDLTSDHVGLAITVQETATNVNGSASAISAATSDVAEAT